MFLTGGTGLVGSHVASVLRTEKLRVWALHRATSDTEHLEGIGCELVEGALEDDEGSLAHLLDWVRGKMELEGKILPEDMDRLLVTDDPEEVVRHVLDLEGGLRSRPSQG